MSALQRLQVFEVSGQDFKVADTDSNGRIGSLKAVLTMASVMLLILWVQYSFGQDDSANSNWLQNRINSLQQQYPGMAVTSGQRSAETQAFLMLNQAIQNPQAFVRLYGNGKAPYANQMVDWVNNHPGSYVSPQVYQDNVSQFTQIINDARAHRRNVSNHLNDSSANVVATDIDTPPANIQSQVEATIQRLGGTVLQEPDAANHSHWHIDWYRNRQPQPIGNPNSNSLDNQDAIPPSPAPDPTSPTAYADNTNYADRSGGDLNSMIPPSPSSDPSMMASANNYQPSGTDMASSSAIPSSAYSTPGSSMTSGFGASPDVATPAASVAGGGLTGATAMEGIRGMNATRNNRTVTNTPGVAGRTSAAQPLVTNRTSAQPQVQRVQTNPVQTNAQHTANHLTQTHELPADVKNLIHKGNVVNQAPHSAAPVHQTAGTNHVAPTLAQHSPLANNSTGHAPTNTLPQIHNGNLLPHTQLPNPVQNHVPNVVRHTPSTNNVASHTSVQNHTPNVVQHNNFAAQAPIHNASPIRSVNNNMTAHTPTTTRTTRPATPVVTANHSVSRPTTSFRPSVQSSSHSVAPVSHVNHTAMNSAPAFHNAPVSHTTNFRPSTPVNRSSTTVRHHKVDSTETQDESVDSQDVQEMEMSVEMN